MWNGTVLAESNSTEVVEGNHYFPADSIKREFFKDSADEFGLPVEGHRPRTTRSMSTANKTPTPRGTIRRPKDAAKNISGYVAFWKGVEVQP